MEGETPHIDVRAVHMSDALALHQLDYSFETDRIYTLRVQDRLLQNEMHSPNGDKVAFAFELVEAQVDPPLYKDYREHEGTLADVESRLQNTEGGYVALADGQIAAGILLRIEESRTV